VPAFFKLIDLIIKIRTMLKIYKSAILLFSLFAIHAGLYAQSNILYYMDMVHQSSFMNPAYQSNCNGYLGLPGFSGASIEGANTAFDYNDLIHNGTGKLKDSLILDIEKIKSSLKNRNYLMTGMRIPILGLGFWVKNAYFTFDVTNITAARISYPENLVNLINGNGNFIGEDNPLEIKGFGPSLINYNELAFGLSKQITHRLTIGGKFKILSGNASLQNQNSSIKLYTQPDTYAMRLETDIKLNVSAPVTFEYDKNGQITDLVPDSVFEVSQVFSMKNMGAAIDLGAIYQFNDKIKFYASVTDLGFIRWKRDVYNISQKGSFEYSGLNLDSIWSDSNYDELETLTDSLADFFTFNSANTKFNTYLGTNLYVGTTYDIGNFMNFGFLSRTYFFDKSIHQAFSLSANLKPTKWFGLSLSYSYINREYRNIGLGFNIKTGPMQFYFLSDNFNVAFKPKDAKVLRFQFGINLYFGCGKRDNFSMLKDKKTLKSSDFM